MPLDYSNPKTLKFFTENFEKSEERRMIWFLKNQDKLTKSATLPETHRGIRTIDVLKAPIEVCMPSMSLQLKSSAMNRRQKPLRDGIVRGLSHLRLTRRHKGREAMNPSSVSDLSVPEPVMKAVDSNERDILYKAIPDGGRLRYLDRRKRTLPEDKYNFCETSSGIIGWRLDDSKLSRQPADYGRYFTFRRDVNSRSGPQPDPHYYQKPSDNPYSKCFG